MHLGGRKCVRVLSCSGGQALHLHAGATVARRWAVQGHCYGDQHVLGRDRQLLGFQA